MEVQKESKVKVIYGYYQVVDGWKHWKPNPMLELTPNEQFEHNREIDPTFRIVENISFTN